MNVREYADGDEEGWVRCRVLSFLETSYFDDVHREKETYENPSIELVAERDDRIVGLIDVECDTAARQVCSEGRGTGGMIWHLAVHPDFQRRGIGTELFREVRRRARDAGIERFEAWTRDDEGTVSWYRDCGFERSDSYLHVYLNREEADRVSETAIENLSINSAFAQYVGDGEAEIRERFDRVHECQLFVREI